MLGVLKGRRARRVKPRLGVLKGRRARRVKPMLGVCSRGEELGGSNQC